MTSIGRRDYYDEADNYFEIRKRLKHNRYSSAFVFLYDRFFLHNTNYINTPILRKALAIGLRPEAYQILDSLCAINLLERDPTLHKHTVYYTLKNPQWWHDHMKEIEEEKKRKKKERENGRKNYNT